MNELPITIGTEDRFDDTDLLGCESRHEEEVLVRISLANRRADRQMHSFRARRYTVLRLRTLWLRKRALWRETGFLSRIVHNAYSS
jgi:hypothetical protein